MSTASAATAASGDGGAASARGAGLEAAGVRSARGEKKAGSGRGRRRRAVGEQRRNEQQRWGQFVDEDEEDFRLVAPSLPNARSRARRNSNRYGLEEDDVVDPDLALALSISSAERNSLSQVEGLSALAIAGLTYESLAQLEDVRCVASGAVVAALPVCSFSKEAISDVRKELAAELVVCVICQSEYDHGDSQVRLPCLHTFHQVCGAEWLLKYSKVCPVCKHDVTEVAAETTS